MGEGKCQALAEKPPPTAEAADSGSDARNSKNINNSYLLHSFTMAEAPTKQKLWGGRFTGKTDPL